MNKQVRITMLCLSLILGLGGATLIVLYANWATLWGVSLFVWGNNIMVKIKGTWQPHP